MNRKALNITLRRATSWIVVLLAFLVRLSAQVEFEVASVKENKDMSPGGTAEVRPSLVRAHHMDACLLSTAVPNVAARSARHL